MNYDSYEYMNESVTVKTAETVVEVIEALIRLERAQFGEIVEELGMAPSTVHDHLSSLQQLGLVNERNGTYQPSLKFLEIGERVRRQRKLFKAGQEQVQQLADETGEHASLMIEENGYGVLLFVAKGKSAVKLNAWSGRHLELSTNAPGKTILAHKPQLEVEEIIERHGLPAYTSHTITSKESLFEEIKQIQEQGYGLDTGELIEGVRAVAAPIIWQDTVCGAIAVGGPKNRMRGDRFTVELPNKLLQASNVVELNMSHI